MHIVTGTTSALNPVLLAAKDYLHRGWRVIPMPPKSKKPKDKGWPDSLIDEADLKDKFSDPGANIGVLLGEPSGGLTDVDLDNAEAIGLADHILPHTNAVFGRPGAHRSHRLFYASGVGMSVAFKDPAGHTVAEIGFTRRQTVLPPSPHPTGELILWHEDGLPLAIEFNVLRMKVAQLAAAALLVPHWPKEGSRQTVALAIAGALAREGYTPDEISHFIGVIAEAVGDEETIKRAKSAEYTEARRAKGGTTTGWPTLAGLVDTAVVKRIRLWLKRSLPEIELAPFPLRLLPRPILAYVSEMSKSFPVAPDFIALPAIVAAGAAIGCSRRIRLKPHWTEGAGLYAGIVGPPGTLKSPAIQKALDPIFRRQQQYTDTYHKEHEKYVSTKSEFERAKRGGKGGEKTLSPPVKPVLKEIFTTDATGEAVAELLMNNQRGLLLYSDELTAWVKGFNQYRNGRGSDKQFYLSAWSNSPHKVNRKEKLPIVLPQPFVSIIGGVQPDVVPDLNDRDGVEDGFFQRLLLIYPRTEPVRWSEVEVCEEVRKAYYDLFEELYDLRWDRASCHDRPSIELGLTPEAQRFFIDWYNGHWHPLTPFLTVARSGHFIRSFVVIVLVSL